MLQYESDGLLIYDITTDKDVCICSSYEMRDKLLKLLNMETSLSRVSLILKQLTQDWNSDEMSAIQGKLSKEDMENLAEFIENCIIHEMEEREIITIN